MKVQVVLHTEYGGFHISDEMALWLEENRNWKIIKYAEIKDYASDLIFSQKKMLVEYPGSRDSVCTYDYDYANSFEFRSDPDLIDCVRALQKKYENSSWRDRNYVDNLSIKNIHVNIEIEDYHDGHERVSCEVRERYDD